MGAPLSAKNQPRGDVFVLALLTYTYVEINYKYLLAQMVADLS
jgi:hypothetical protein